MLESDREYEIQAAIRIENLGTGRNETVAQWTGFGTLSYLGHRYASGKILAVGDLARLPDPQGGGSSFVLDISDRADRERMLSTDPGPAPVTLLHLYRKRFIRGNRTWSGWTAAVTYRGRLSEAHYDNGSLSIEVQREFDAVWRGEILRWTGADQRRRYPGDSGLDRADRVRRSGLLLSWQA